MKKGFITTKQVAHLLGVTTTTVRRWDKTGKLKATRHPFNNYRLYQLVEIKKLSESLGMK